MSVHAPGRAARRALLLLAGVAAGIVALVPPAVGSTMIPLPLATLADHAGQVIVGEVAATRSYWAENPRRIETEVVFQQVEYLKGRLPDSDTTFTLLLPGGTAGEMTVRLTDMPTFAAGEKWVLFLAPEYTTYPVVGLSQGAFRVAADADGVQRVYDADRRPVAGLDSEGLVAVSQASPGGAATHLVSANHIRIKESSPAPRDAQPLSYADFAAQIRPILDQSRDHHLTAPAGRPVFTRCRSVPLRLFGAAPVAPLDSARISAAASAAQPVAPPTARTAPAAEPVAGTPDRRADR